MTTLRIQVAAVQELWFAAGDPVRAASGVAPLGGGWLIAQDDATQAVWWDPRSGQVRRIRLFDPVQGVDTFEEAAGTKHLKPDLEAACAVTVGGLPGVLLLGSGSLAIRTRGALVVGASGDPVVRTADLAPLYDRVRVALGLGAGQLNLEGACVVVDAGGRERLRWFQRGHGGSAVPSASVDVDLAAVVATVADGGAGGDADWRAAIGSVRRYDLGDVDGVALGITDAVTLPDGRVLVSAAAEDSPDAVADGPTMGAVLAILDGDVALVGRMPQPQGPWKVEGLALVAAGPGRAEVLAVTDQDDPAAPSLAIRLVIGWNTAAGDRVTVR